jgi:hypothetical protein
MSGVQTKELSWDEWLHALALIATSSHCRGVLDDRTTDGWHDLQALAAGDTEGLVNAIRQVRKPAQSPMRHAMVDRRPTWHPDRHFYFLTDK